MVNPVGNPGKPRELEEFLQPKAMLTPGIAGGLTMLITNALTSQFGLLPNYTGLVISFLFGLIVFRTTAAIPRLQLAAYYALNSLIIFSVALGTNHAGVGGAKALHAKESGIQIADWSPGTPFFANWLDGTVQNRDHILKSIGTCETRLERTSCCRRRSEGRKASPFIVHRGYADGCRR